MKNKNYLSIDIENMFLYDGIDERVPDTRMEPMTLSNGEKLKLFFEYVVPKRGRTPANLKEFVTRRTYTTFRGFHSIPGGMYDHKTGTVAFERESYPEFFMNNAIREDALFYFERLKNDGVYKEYVSKVNDFYKIAMTHKKEAAKEDSQDSQRSM